MKKEAGAPGFNQGTLSNVKVLLLKTCVLLLAAVHPSDSEEKAARKLIETIEDGKITTPGLFRGWCKKLWYLPNDLKMRVWIALSDRIDKTDWNELKIRNAEIERELREDMEKQLEHIAELKR
jgi:hypothetical protein